MVLRNSRYSKNGVTTPLIEGKIQLQSEAAEVFYKEVMIKEINELPRQYSAFFNE